MKFLLSVIICIPLGVEPKIFERPMPCPFFHRTNKKCIQVFTLYSIVSKESYHYLNITSTFQVKFASWVFFSFSKVKQTILYFLGSRRKYDSGFIIFFNTLQLIDTNLTVVCLHEYLKRNLPSTFYI
jgi:hypothetical protein